MDVFPELPLPARPSQGTGVRGSSQTAPLPPAPASPPAAGRRPEPAATAVAQLTFSRMQFMEIKKRALLRCSPSCTSASHSMLRGRSPLRAQPLAPRFTTACPTACSRFKVRTSAPFAASDWLSLKSVLRLHPIQARKGRTLYSDSLLALLSARSLRPQVLAFRAEPGAPWGHCRTCQQRLTAASHWRRDPLAAGSRCVRRTAAHKAVDADKNHPPLFFLHKTC